MQEFKQKLRISSYFKLGSKIRKKERAGSVAMEVIASGFQFLINGGAFAAASTLSCNFAKAFVRGDNKITFPISNYESFVCMPANYSPWRLLTQPKLASIFEH